MSLRGREIITGFREGLHEIAFRGLLCNNPLLPPTPSGQPVDFKDCSFSYESCSVANWGKGCVCLCVVYAAGVGVDNVRLSESASVERYWNHLLKSFFVPISDLTCLCIEGESQR